MRKLIGLFLFCVLFRDPAKIVLRFLREEERRASEQSREERSGLQHLLCRDEPPSWRASTLFFFPLTRTTLPPYPLMENERPTLLPPSEREVPNEGEAEGV